MYGVGESSPRRRGWLVIIGVLALILLVGGIFLTFYFLVIRDDGASSTPDETPTMIQVVAAATNTALVAPIATDTAVPATPTSLPTLTPTDTPLPTPTLRPPPEVITVGVRARVNLSEGLSLNLRDLPSLNNSTIITQLVAGAEVDVVEGPELEGDRTWWSIDGGAGKAGWVVEALGDEVLLLPFGWSSQLPPLAAALPTATPTLTPTAVVVTPTLAPATATPTAAATATPAATPILTATAVLTPTATPEGGIPSPTVGGRARVTTQYEYINLRAAAGLGAETVGQLENGTVVSILAGPEEADGLRWWQVDDGQGNTGWAAERVGGEVLLVPIP